jgi:hypothetical protein
MKELDRKDTPEVTGGNVGPYAPPITIGKPILPAPGPVPEYPSNPSGPELPVIEKYLT